MIRRRLGVAKDHRDVDQHDDHAHLSRGKVELAERPDGLIEPIPSADDGEAARCAAVERVLARFDQVISFGGPPYPRREEL